MYAITVLDGCVDMLTTEVSSHNYQILHFTNSLSLSVTLALLLRLIKKLKKHVPSKKYLQSVKFKYIYM